MSIELLLRRHALLPHEPAFMLLEVPKWCQQEDRHHRVQYIWVAREGKLTRFETDLGPWSGLPLRVVGLWEESVAALRGIADRERQLEAEDRYWQKHMDELRQESTLIKRAVFVAETNEYVIYNRSHFGPRFRKQRNGFSQALQKLYELQKVKHG